MSMHTLIVIHTSNNNHVWFRSEAIEGSLPKGRSMPQFHHMGLYIERISGTAFVSKRHENKQTFLYRILPSTAQTPWTHLDDHPLNHNNAKDLQFLPDQYVWPPAQLERECNFIDGMRMLGGAGDPMSKEGVGYYQWSCGVDMDPKKAFYSADGDWLIVPIRGIIDVHTEFGDIRCRPCEIVVIPRGIRYRVTLPKGPAVGYMFEAYSGHYTLPELGPIGSIGLANARDFEIPTAKYWDTDEKTEVFAKFGGKIHKTTMQGSAFNAVCWQGTYYPFKYDMGRFNPVGFTLVDHQDPSVFTVLTCPSAKENNPAVDFLWFGPRWLPMEDTFQLPYFHRNTMSEFSVALKGGFDLTVVPKQMLGMATLHNTVSPHGLGADEVEKAMRKDMKPERVPDTTGFFLVESW